MSLCIFRINRSEIHHMGSSLWRLFLRLHVLLEGLDFLADVWNLCGGNKKERSLDKHLIQRTGKKTRICEDFLFVCSVEAYRWRMLNKVSRFPKTWDEDDHHGNAS